MSTGCNRGTTISVVFKMLIRFRFLIGGQSHTSVAVLSKVTIQIDDGFSTRQRCLFGKKWFSPSGTCQATLPEPAFFRFNVSRRQMEDCFTHCVTVATHYASFCTNTSSWRILSGVSQQLLPHVHTSTLPKSIGTRSPFISNRSFSIIVGSS